MKRRASLFYPFKKSFPLLKHLLIITSIFFAQKSFTQNALQQNLTTTKAPKVSGNASLTYNSNLYRDGADAIRTTGADLTLNYAYNPPNMFRVYADTEKSFTDEERWSFGDTRFSWVNNAFWKSSPKLIIGQQLRASLPTSRESRFRDRNRGMLSFVPVFISPIHSKVLLIYQPMLHKNFHKSFVNNAKQENVSWSFQQVFVANISLADRLYFQPVLNLSRVGTYRNTQKDQFGFAAEFGYTLGKGVTLAGGWSQRGQIRDMERGPDQTIELFNERQAIVYSALYYLF
jgi:hypothetical protein